jgi:hypothetical protein
LGFYVAAENAYNEHALLLSIPSFINSMSFFTYSNVSASGFINCSVAEQTLSNFFPKTVVRLPGCLPHPHSFPFEVK